MERGARLLCLFLFVLLCRAQAQSPAPVLAVDHGPNAAAQQSKHYVVMVSLDGFRYDYAKKYGAKHLLDLVARGASAPDGMIPAYPSLTFPNQYTLVTGLYPEHHGIVANEFYDPERKQRFSSSDSATVADGFWYGGTPLWSLAEKQGMRTACFFWAGSEAKIAGKRPSWYLRHDDKFPDKKRISQVIAWLKLPLDQRPHFIALSWSKVDYVEHEFGPDSQQTAEAVHQVDALIGTLEREIDALHLPIDLIIVSDHGMARVQESWIDLDQYAPLTGAITIGTLLYTPTEPAANGAYQKLKAADAAFMVYRRANVPAELHFNGNPREGDPVIVAQGPYAIRARRPPGSEDRPPFVGMDGLDAFMVPEMKAIFYAEGPDIRRGVALKPFENVNVYPLLVKILGLSSPPVDGSLGVLSGILTESSSQ